MGREQRRLLLDPQRLQGLVAGQPIPLQPEEQHYLRRVLRLRSGDGLAVVDGCGRRWDAVVQPGSGGGVALALVQELAHPQEQQPKPLAPLTLALAVPRRDADLAWRMACELGADRLQPLLSTHGVVRDRQPLERWATILREACEQCERLWLPELASPAEAGPWLASMAAGAVSRTGPAPLLLLATTRRSGLPLLGSWLSQQTVPGPVALAIGPEGGWSADEERAAETAGWQPVSLGPSILRTATAAVAGMAQLSAWRSALSCASCPSPSP